MRNMFVQSLRRLYIAGRIDKETVAIRVRNGKITADDYKWITGEPFVE